jgi:hypothetical protein
VKNYPDKLKRKKSSFVEELRIKNSTEQLLNQYFNNLQELMEKNRYHPSMIGNFDETMCNLAERKIFVVIPADAKQGIRPEPTLRFHITLGVTVFVDGSHTNPLIIFPQKELPNFNLTGFDVDGQESGWINDSIFEDYCRKNIIPRFLENKGKIPSEYSTRGLLLLDAHPSRNNYNLM